MSTIKANTIQNLSGVEKYLLAAWVNFNGTGTVAIRASGNVSSITDNGVGDYTVNFTNPLADGSYVLMGSSKFVDDSQGVQPANVATPFTTTSARIYTLTNLGTASGGGVVDSDLISASFVR